MYDDTLRVTYNQPDFLRSLLELHKGHGPRAFTTLSIIMAIGLLLVLLSGFWLGVSSTYVRIPTLVLFGLGLAVFAILGYAV